MQDGKTYENPAVYQAVLEERRRVAQALIKHGAMQPEEIASISMLSADEMQNLLEIPTAEQVRATIVPLLSAFDVKEAILFGSVAKGTATATSDVDLVVDSDLRGFAFVELANALKRELGRSVDVFGMRQIVPGSPIETEIRNTGVQIYG